MSVNRHRLRPPIGVRLPPLQPSFSYSIQRLAVNDPLPMEGHWTAPTHIMPALYRHTQPTGQPEIDGAENSIRVDGWSDDGFGKKESRAREA